MTFSYDSSTTGLQDDTNQVRFLIQDTSSGDYRFEDSEIDFEIAIKGSVNAAVEALAIRLWAYWAKKADKTVGSLSISYGALADHYKALAAQLREDAASTATLYFGGISRTTVQAELDDTDRVPPSFYVGMLDNPPASVGGSSS